jgi:biofilm PGA synthesis N-glycosyltransferase PgaC
MTLAEIKKISGDLTVIIPAYNEVENVADTVKSLLAQTCPPKTVIVVDDGSTDGTGEAARAAGAMVLRPPQNTGSKAGAQNYALQQVETAFCMAVDADTILALDGLEKLLAAFADPQTVAACGFVIPRHVRTVWERGRYIEYLFAFTFYKPVQDYFGRPLISSGCFSAYRTAILKAEQGWRTRTMAEDMDFTWSVLAKGYGVRFIPEAVCYPIEPHNFHFMSKQLRRWSHGFVQNVMLHWRNILNVPYLRTAVAVSVWDGLVASVAYLFLIPFLAIVLGNPWILLAYVLDLPAVAVPVLVAAVKRREVWRALTSLPAFWVLRTVNAVFVVSAFFSELVLRRRLSTYEKGH